MAPTFKATIPASREDAAFLVDLLTEMLDPAPVAEAVEVNGYWVVEAHFAEPPDAAAFAAIGEIRPGLIPPGGPRLEQLAEEDWVAKVQRGLHPVRAGRFLVHGSHDRARVAANAFAIEIDAGQAFGTAHHGTTRGCLLALDALAKRVRIESVLDLGAGSGVLAIAAAKVMRGEVLATDIDPVAVVVAAENFARNGVAAQIDAVVADGPRHPAITARAPFGLIMANILAAPLIGFAKDMPALLTPGDYLILSGLLTRQAREVTARLAAQGFTLMARYPLDEWMTLLMRWRGPSRTSS